MKVIRNCLRLITPYNIKSCEACFLLLFMCLNAWAQYEYFVPERNYSQAITIDGNINADEWGAPSFIVNKLNGYVSGTVSNDDDCSFRVWLKHNSDTLYVAISVREDYVRQHEQYWDNISLFLTPDYVSSATDLTNPYLGTFGQEWDFIMDNSCEKVLDDESVVFFNQTQADSAGVKLQNSWTDWEMRISLNKLFPFPVHNGDTIGFNCSYLDFDENPKIETHIGVLAWTKSHVWLDPNNSWGKLILAQGADTIKPSVTIISPNGGEEWAAGSIKTIVWNAQDNRNVINRAVFLSTDNAQTWSKLDSAYGNNDTLQWTLPQDTATLCFIRVKAYDQAGNVGIKESSAPFRIVSKPYFTSPTLVRVNTNSQFSYNVTYVIPDTTLKTFDLEYANLPAWANTIVDSIYGTTPAATSATHWLITLKAGNLSTTLDLFFIVQNPGNIGDISLSPCLPILEVTPINFFSGKMDFKVGLEKPGGFTLGVYDIEGRNLWNYQSETRQADYVNITWNPAYLSNGAYFIVLKQQNKNAVKKFVITR